MVESSVLVDEGIHMSNTYSMQKPSTVSGGSPYAWMVRGWVIRRGQQRWTREQIERHVKACAPKLDEFMQELQKKAYAFEGDDASLREWYECKAAEAREDYERQFAEAVGFITDWLRENGAVVVDANADESVVLTN